jgi:TolB-like protein/lipoprotein NlpI
VQIESLAVLPLDNLSGDPEQEYFSDGMTETLITELSKISALKVISRTSAMRYKDTDKSLPEIARELNVDAIVEGSVLRAGERVRITAQLVHAETDEHIWADNYDRDVSDVLALHSEVARAIAQEVRVQLTPQEESRLSSSRSINPEAHEAYLRGVHYGKRRNLENALKYFNRAIEIDPSYALPYAGLASLHVGYAVFGLARPEDVVPKARAALSKALELDENLAELHGSSAVVMWMYDWNWPAAERAFKRAIELNPGLAATHYAYGNYLVMVGRESDAMAEHRRALELDPLSPPQNWAMAHHSFRSGHDDAAIERLEEILEMEPDFILALSSLSEAYYLQGRIEESLAMVKRLYTSRGETSVVEALDRGYEISGFTGAMRSAAEELVEQSHNRYIPAHPVAWLYAFADEKDKAMDWLEVAFDEREPFLLGSLRVGILHDRLQSDPRFQDIIRRMNFPE